MLCYKLIADSVYLVELDGSVGSVSMGSVSVATPPLDQLSECTDPKCIYTRSNSRIRQMWEDELFKFGKRKYQTLRILIYASFLLYQELRLLQLFGEHIDELHLTDHTYNELRVASDNKYHKAFQQFMQTIRCYGLQTKIFVHTDPTKLLNHIVFSHYFDIIAGIDIDSITMSHIQHRTMMLDISRASLKVDGAMYVSQHFADQVDLCRYEFDIDGQLKLSRADYFVKPRYYFQYVSEYVMKTVASTLKYPSTLISIVTSFIMLHRAKLSVATIIPAILIVPSVCGLSYLIDRWFGECAGDRMVTICVQKFSALFE